MRSVVMLCLFCLIFAPLSGCGPSLEDSVEGLGSDDPQVQRRARQELLLAKERAVEPLLAALEDPALAGARPALVEVLAGLLRRLGDQRIETALVSRLATDEQATVRAACAHHLGANKRHRALDPLLAALEDSDGEVRYQALLALSLMENRLDPQQQDRLRQRSRLLAADKHAGVRLEAGIRVEAFVHDWIEAAAQAALAAQLSAAESLYVRALEYAPNSKRAHYRLARFLVDNGDADQGVKRLERHGMVMRVGRTTEKPLIDGHLNEALWHQSAQVDSFFLYSSLHYAAVPSQVRTRVHMAYDDEALYIGFHCFDSSPDSLVARSRDFDDSLWMEDIVEIFLDPGFDYSGYVHMGINSLGTASDAAYGGSGADGSPPRWNARARIASQVGADFWSAECRIEFGQDELLRPAAGARWGLNFVRTYRGAEYSQWVRTYSGGHSPDDFGLAIFE
jgi:hypothetical protein